MKNLDVLEHFSLPNNIDVESLSCKDNYICIVSIVGKSSYNSCYSKGDALNEASQKEIFNDIMRNDPCSDISLLKLCQIYGHFDSKRRIIYLNLLSAFDAYQMGHICESANDELSHMGFRNFFENAEFMFARAILYLFSISHIIVFAQPDGSFDVKYVRLFRTVEKIRQKLQIFAKDVLVDFPISKEWMTEGRFCCPRVLFLMEAGKQLSRLFAELPAGTQRTGGIKAIQHKLEDQIYRILRKSRILGDSRNSLFSIPANQEFVFIRSEQSAHTDPTSFFLNYLKNKCVSAAQSGTPSPRYHSHHSGRRIDGSVSGDGSNVFKETESSNNNFRQFIMQHVDTAMNKGFDDGGSRSISLPFELPTLASWLTVTQALYSFFMLDHADSRVRPHFGLLKSLLDIDVRFSESRCEKVLPQALAAYQEGLPKFYIRQLHESKLQQARHVFQQHARGPAADAYLRQLEEECESLWRSGRQMCEQVSLTGNHCINELHRTAEEITTDDNRHLPVMAHSSQLKQKAVCNCGSTLGEREDPFDHRFANYEFYKRLATSCCSKLEQYEMPVFRPADGEEIRPVIIMIAKPHQPATQLGDSLTVAVSEQPVSLPPPVSTSSNEYSSSMAVNLANEPALAEDSVKIDKEDLLHELSALSLNNSLSRSALNDSSVMFSLGQSAGDTRTRLIPDMDATNQEVMAVQETEQLCEQPATFLNEQTESSAMFTEQSVTLTTDQPVTSTTEQSVLFATEQPVTFTIEQTEQSEVLTTEQSETFRPEQPVIFSTEPVEDIQSPDGSDVNMELPSTSKFAERQPSTSEYLSTMFNSESPSGLLPRFPSWSLVALSDYASYQNSKGLEQSNFLPGSNFLLSLDIGGSSDKAPSDKGGKSWSSRPKRNVKSSHDLGKIYVGFEYECSRGHRYMLSSPDKLQRAQLQELYKESASKILAGSMPLYFPCQCRSSNKPVYGQLMRMFIALPDSCPEVKLYPLVQPHPLPCPTFHCGVTGGLPVKAGKLWVLRFPYIYVGENGAYQMPMDIKQIEQCRVATKNILVFDEIND